MKNYEALSKAHFDKQAATYDEKNTTYYSKNGKISCQDIAKQLRETAYWDLLDVGCGTGYLLELLAAQRSANYVGLDLSAKMLTVAKQKNIAGATFVEGTADKLPFDNDTFDVVTCSQSFHHYPYQEKAMREAYRVLKKGGVYMLSDTGVGGLGAWLDNHIFFKLMQSGDCRTQNRHGIKNMMQKTGFTVTDCRRIQGLIYTVVGRKNE